MKISAFITNLGKYNEGELVGKWIDLPIDEEELKEVLKEIGINENYEEYFFTDYAGCYKLNLSEYENIEHLNEIAEKLEDWDYNLFMAACELDGLDYVLNSCPDDYMLFSNVTNEQELGEYYAYELECIDFSSNPMFESYFDFERYGRDIYLETTSLFTGYGYIERIR